jgi:signal transduction histidine kinase/FixJ family two-component response regulator
MAHDPAEEDDAMERARSASEPVETHPVPTPPTVQGPRGESHDVQKREGAVAAREGTATGREVAAGAREAAVRQREETSALREEAILAREEAQQARAALERLNSEIREVNERLVIATLHAQAMADDADRANRLKDEFLATVSHELRTPLSAVLGWARMLGSMPLPPDRAKQGAATIERNAVALVRIIDDLLDVSRTIAGKLHLEAQLVELPVVVRAALDSVRHLAASKKLTLSHFSSLTPADVIRGDPGRLEQVVSNLLTNAIKFTPEGGRVDVFVERSNDYAEVRVVDSGEGISPQFLPFVFDRFRQADGATTRRHAGLGLGLAIVRQLVELHGGTVHAASEGEGRGATFTVRLPVPVVAPSNQRGPSDEATAAAPLHGPAASSLENLRIVVVDDDADGRTLTSLILTEAGANVRSVSTVREALQVLESDPADALVSDIGLPEADGYSLIREIRRREAEHGGFLPALALTGYAQPEDRARTLAEGFQAYISKPVEPRELTAAIAAMTRRARDTAADARHDSHKAPSHD